MNPIDKNTRGCSDAILCTCNSQLPDSPQEPHSSISLEAPWEPRTRGQSWSLGDVYCSVIVRLRPELATEAEVSRIRLGFEGSSGLGPESCLPLSLAVRGPQLLCLFELPFPHLKIEMMTMILQNGCKDETREGRHSAQHSDLTG